jgi:hypothetical protein
LNVVFGPKIVVNEAQRAQKYIKDCMCSGACVWTFMFVGDCWGLLLFPFHSLSSAGNMSSWFSQLVSKSKPSEKAIGQQLCTAARDGNVEELRRLIDGGADVNDTSYYVSVYVVHSAAVKPRNMMNPVTP